ncbi:TnpV protein [Thomasclavelia sp.]
MKDIKYTKVGDYYFPNIKAPTKNNYQLGKYAIMKLAYLKEHDKSLYHSLLLEGKLEECLQNTDIETNDMYEILLTQYKDKWGITEELKEKNQMQWAQEMNNIKKCIDERILNFLMD